MEHIFHFRGFLVIFKEIFKKSVKSLSSYEKIIIELVSLNNQDLTIILTGGDAEILAKRLKNTIFANSNFLLESLNALHQYNTKWQRN